MTALGLRTKQYVDLNPGEFTGKFAGTYTNIKSVRFIPPKLGAPGFGKIRVTLRNPLHAFEVKHG